jgi:uncharacterized metal-binding protein
LSVQLKRNPVMSSQPAAEKVLVVPCSGIGKVHGLISREAAYRVVDTLMPGQAETLCLALLVTGDPEARAKVHESPCIAVDGCPKLCARKNIELSGSKAASGVRVYDTLKRRHGAQFGSPTALSDEGWAAADEIAAEIAQTARLFLNPNPQSPIPNP